MALQVLCDTLRIGAVLAHAHGQALEAEICQKCVVRGLHRAEVAHELGRGLCDERAAESEAFRICHPVVAFVRRAQAGEFFGIFRPIEFAAVDDAAAEGRRMAVHILCGGVRHDIRAPRERAAVDGRGKRVVHDERHAMGMGRSGELFDIQHGQGRVGDGLAEHGLCVRAERGVQLLLGAVGIDEGAFDPHALHRHGKQIIAAAVNGRGAHDVVAATGDIEHSHKIGSLPGAGQHGGRAALERRDLRRDVVAGRILQAGIEIAVRLEVKELSHGLGGLIAECCALDDRDLARFAVARRVAGLNAERFRPEIGSFQNQDTSNREE